MTDRAARRSTQAEPRSAPAARPRELRTLGLRLLLAAALALAAAPGASALPFDALVAFGDSLSDVGDEPPAPATPPDFGGRFSNGPVWHEYLASDLGLEEAETRSYAIGGATSGEDGLQGSGTGLLAQVEDYTDAPPAVGARPLFTVWAGGNDAIGAALTGGGDALEPDALGASAAENVRDAVARLADAGARDFLVPDLPDAGRFPIAGLLGDGSLPDEASAYSLAFNAALDDELAALEASRGLNVHRLRASELFDAIVDDPAAFGIANVSEGCTSVLPFGESGPPCDDPERHLFWDEVHPTTGVHALLGERGLRAVPEPGTALLVAAGLAGAALARRRR